MILSFTSLREARRLPTSLRDARRLPTSLRDLFRGRGNLLAAIVLLAVCSPISKTTSSITLKTESSQTPYVRLEIVTPEIIRVTSGIDARLRRDPSLITVYAETPCKWTSHLSKDSLEVTTSTLKATIDRKTGFVSFYDTDGKRLISESQKSLDPITFQTDRGYTLYQKWQTAPEEAFYGLGQHQGDEFNWAGRNESLIQYNTKVTIPFLVSSSGYGILWDNYSMSRFGDPRDYAQIGEVFKLYTPDGVTGALQGTYTSSKGETITRQEPLIYLEHAKALQENLIREFPLKGSTVVYEGFLEPSQSGTFRFRLYYSGYVKVFLAGEEVVAERWRTAWNPNTYKFDFDLRKGDRTPIRIEWKPDGDVAYCSLRALSPTAGYDEDPHVAFWSEMGDNIDYYFVHGKNIDDVISGYRALTGKAPVMPKWTMGLWQCRERYACSKDIYDVLEHFEEDGLPLDMIIQDWFYWNEDQWGSHEFDRSRYPDPKALVDSVHQKGVRFMISVWPKFYLGTEHFDEFDSQGWMYRQAVADSIRDWVGPGYVGSFYDAYSPDARKLFWKQMEDHLVPLGIDAWWMDASEPNVRDCVDMDYWKALCNPTVLGTSTKYLNAYGLMNADAIYNGQKSLNPDSRVLLLTRSGFAGLQRYSTAIWSGDIASRWEDLKAQIPAGINFSMAGVPWWTMDTGGFCVEDRFSSPTPSPEDLEEWRELQARWYQFGAFTPFFRVHGQSPVREYYVIAPQGHNAQISIKQSMSIRNLLLPYIYSMAGWVWKDDYTIMRGLAMDFGHDAAALQIGDEYMFGPAFLVAPVYTYKARSRQVYLPENEGGWYDYYSGTRVSEHGGETIKAPAPYHQMPLYIRAGSIIPNDITEGRRHSLDQDSSCMAIDIYEGIDGKFEIYEDDGVSCDYTRGEYCTISLEWEDAARTLRIGQATGSYLGMPESRTFHIRLHQKSGSSPKNTVVTYTNSPIEVQL